MFFLLFPRKFIEDVIIIEMNKHLDKRMTLGEFLRWIGIWFFLSTLSGFNRRSFWSSREVSREDGAPYRFHDWMSQTRSEEILSAIQYTDKEPPLYLYRFWEVKQMIDCWNEICKKILVHPGYRALMNQCLFGSTNSHAQGGSFVPESPTRSVTNTILAVDFLGLCMLLS